MNREMVFAKAMNRTGDRSVFKAGWSQVAALMSLVVLLVAAQALHAATDVKDDSALKPPPGWRIAIVEFDDLQCPACSQTNPLLMAAVVQYKIPWVRHFLLIPMHNWSRNAAINAMWFEQQKKGLGNEYENQVFANQSSIYNPLMLRQFTEKFAQEHGIQMPFDMDPQGKLANAVEEDNQLSRRTGINQTPTIFIVTEDKGGKHYVEVTDHSKLYQTIDAALASLKRQGLSEKMGK
jgi:protein-disulfide isomerase